MPMFSAVLDRRFGFVELQIRVNNPPWVFGMSADEADALAEELRRVAAELRVMPPPPIEYIEIDGL